MSRQIKKNHSRGDNPSILKTFQKEITSSCLETLITWSFNHVSGTIHLSFKENSMGDNFIML